MRRGRPAGRAGFALLPVVLALALLGAACGDDDPSAESTTPPTEAATPDSAAGPTSRTT